ncbi:MAG: hypothetical protein ACR2NZ_05465, partial [Rubripirellula sp.]
MPATKISDLLPISESTGNPHAYQVFGLEDGEQDNATISKAIQSVVAKLKAVKADTDPKLWAKAAKLVQQSRVTLANAESKAQLDARFGIIAVTDESPASADPLASVLPSSDPLANILPAEDPLATANSQASTDPLAAILPTADPSVAQPESPAPQSPAASVALEPTIDLTSAGQDSNPM